jgi:drug/metabolite transporter (DMT)-like permease
MPLSAFLLAIATIGLWSFLAYFGAKLSHLPPFFVVGIALCVGSLVGMPRIREWRVPLLTLLIGIGGIFGYHFLYFSAYRYAPAVEASLINYLWPLLIVLLSPVFLSGYHLKRHHIFGALLGLAGAGLITSSGSVQVNRAYLPGYLLAAGAALVWACYSLLTKKRPPFSSAAVGFFCLCSGLLSLAAFGLSQAANPAAFTLTSRDALLLIVLGLGPMGAAFYLWDAALKRGDPRVIGSLAYLTPLTSTLVLVVIGGKSLSPLSAVAMLLIVSGAILGSADLLPRRINPVA